MNAFPDWARATTAVAAGLILALGAAGSSPANAAQPAVLTPEVASMLQSIAVDEKAAHDSYREFAARYGEPGFGTIADGESRHRDTLRALLAKHSVVDPTIGDPVGAFDDADRQARYDELTARGAVSLANAVEAAIRTERMLAASLSAVAARDLPRDAGNVVANLREGARHHLEAYETLLARAVTTPPALATSRVAQTAQVQAPRSGRYRVGARLVLAAAPVRTDAGVTVRWRVMAESAETCRVRTREGRATVQLRKPGVCRVIGYAPAPSPDYLDFRVGRAYRVLG